MREDVTKSFDGRMYFNTEEEALKYVEEALVDELVGCYEEPEEITEEAVQANIDSWLSIHRIVKCSGPDVEKCIKQAKKDIEEFNKMEEKEQEDKEYKQYLELKKKFGDK